MVPFLRERGPKGCAAERFLHDIAIMDHSGWIARPHGSLTRTGAPVQMTFLTDATALCLTTDLRDPGVAASDRLAQACAAMIRFGGATADPALRKVVASAQAAGPLDFGARLDLTIADRGHDLRILAELPPQGVDPAFVLMPCIDNALQATNGDLSLTMLGFGKHASPMTLYGHITGATWHDLLLLTTIAAVSPDPLAIAIDGLSRIPPDNALPVARLGFSLTIESRAQPPTLTVFFDAVDLLGNHHAIVQRMMAGWGKRLPGYAAMIDHWSAQPTHPTPHGQIGLTAVAETMPRLSINVAAPWSAETQTMTSQSQCNRCLR